MGQSVKKIIAEQNHGREPLLHFDTQKKALKSRFVQILPLPLCSEGDFTPAVNKHLIKNIIIKNDKICSYLVFQWQMFYPL